MTAMTANGPRISLSDRVKMTCKKHWFGADDPRTCKGCPLYTPCTAPCAGGPEALNAHTIALNEAAEAIR
jgi:hypothetical protein